MNESLFTEEQNYRYQERLGILCGSDKPTPEQEEIALMDVFDLPEEGTPL